MAIRSPRTGITVDTTDVDRDAGPAPTPQVQDIRVQLKMRELVARVMERTGARKTDVKSIAEATLSVLGAALANGEDLNVPPLGKVMVKRDTTNHKARVFTVKVRQAKTEV